MLITQSQQAMTDTHNTFEPIKAFFDTPANRQRFAIIQLLTKRSATMTEPIDALGYEQNVISRHLHRLKCCGVVTAQRRDKKRVYTFNKQPSNR